jgi:dihydrofolate reductase
MPVSLIAALAQNRAIGLDNQLPWHLSADLKRFKSITMGKPILMGRRTHESIGRALPGRTNLILSADPDYRSPGCRVVHSLDEALREAGESGELMVIGGASLYERFLPRASRLYLTLIGREFPGDTFFPAIDWSRWEEVYRENVTEDAGAGFPYSFVNLERRPAPAP